MVTDHPTRCGTPTTGRRAPHRRRPLRSDDRRAAEVVDFPDAEPAGRPGADDAAAQDPAGDPRLGGAPWLPAERPRDRSGGRAEVAVVGRPPAQGAGEAGAAAPGPEPAAGRRHPAAGGRRSDGVDPPQPTPTYVPVVGRIAAGGPILAEQAIEDVFPLPKELVGEGTLFLLRVVGDSMIDAAITDGDWVVVRQQPVAENGDIVAAMIDGEATVKTFQPQGRPRLADAAQRGLRADPRRRRGHPGPGRHGAAQALISGSERSTDSGRHGRRIPPDRCLPGRQSAIGPLTPAAGRRRSTGA